MKNDANQVENRPFRILSLDGGGIRGAFSASFLADLEKRIERPLCDFFDLVAGTSTGGIIAAALASGEPASRIVEFYHKHGPLIFSRPAHPVCFQRGIAKFFINKVLRRAGLDYDWLFYPKYNSDPLRAALTEVFGERTIETLKQSRLVVSAVDLIKGQNIVFKTPHMPGLVRDRHFRIVDVLLATTAAPTYFPHATIGKGSAFIDGGVWANNPTMVAIAEALRIGKNCNRVGIDTSVNLNSISVLSVGTGRAKLFAKPPTNGGGVAWWLPRLIDVVSISQSQGVHFESQYLLDDHYQRIDFDLPNTDWKLDAAEFVDQLLHLGSAVSAENFIAIQRQFLREPRTNYTPFPNSDEHADASVAYGYRTSSECRVVTSAKSTPL